MQGKLTPALTHVAMHVRYFDECIAFYTEYCGMQIVHERGLEDPGDRVVWLSEPGREKELIFVLIPGGPERPAVDRDFAHLGFALESRDAVDRIAERGREAGCLAWEPVEEPYPVGYYCALHDPEGTFVEFSYGQPLGPGAEDAEDAEKEAE
jgi:catechol 2,3-dioxygenase-like lactoylglutathione lyase family enzyme